MNGGISIVLPMPTIVIQFPAGYGQPIEVKFPCIQCGQCAVQPTNEIKEERMGKHEVDTEIKVEVDVENQINIKEEPICEFKMDEGILHNDPNLYLNQFSPVSDSNSENEENYKLFLIDQTDGMSDTVYEECLNDILKLVEYLKEDIVFH